jgi:hypothetical protein
VDWKRGCNIFGRGKPKQASFTEGFYCALRNRVLCCNAISKKNQKQPIESKMLCRGKLAADRIASDLILTT